MIIVYLTSSSHRSSQFQWVHAVSHITWILWGARDKPVHRLIAQDCTSSVFARSAGPCRSYLNSSVSVSSSKNQQHCDTQWWEVSTASKIAPLRSGPLHVPHVPHVQQVHENGTANIFASCRWLSVSSVEAMEWRDCKYEFKKLLIYSNKWQNK